MELGVEPPRLTVIKVGGSLIEGKADLDRVASAIVERRRGGGPLLVVGSALRGVTDRLELAAIQALDRQHANRGLGKIMEGLRRRHLEATAGLADGDSAHRAVQRALDEVDRLVGTIQASRVLDDATYARLLSYGERMSVRLLAAAIGAAGGEAEPIDAEEAGLRAAGPCCAGTCDLEASAEGLERMRRRLADRILVLTGFYGVDEQGAVVLFGRGGSDDTACAVAAGLSADRLELWKDVPGFLSADPRDVHRPQVIREVSFDEVEQLGAYGSCVVNHGCLKPLRGRSTRVVISSVEGAPSDSGTLLIQRLRRRCARVVALVGRTGYTEFRLDDGPQHRIRELAGRVLTTLAGAKIPFERLDAGRGGVRFLVDDLHVDRVRPVLGEMANGHAVGIRRAPPLIGAVGEGVAEDPEIRSRMLRYLSRTGVRTDLVAQPSGSSGLSCTVHPDDLLPALIGLHDQFFGRRQNL